MMGIPKVILGSVNEWKVIIMMLDDCLLPLLSAIQVE